MFQTEVISYRINGGGVVPHFQTARKGGFSIKYYDFFCSTFEEKIKLHISKRFFKKTFKIGQNSIFPNFAVQHPPPIDTQTIKQVNQMQNKNE